MVLCKALLNQASFHTLLLEFEDEADRENVCHRLGLVPGPDGLTFAARRK